MSWRGEGRRGSLYCPLSYVILHIAIISSNTENCKWKQTDLHDHLIYYIYLQYSASFQFPTRELNYGLFVYSKLIFSKDNARLGGLEACAIRRQALRVLPRTPWCNLFTKTKWKSVCMNGSCLAPSFRKFVIWMHVIEFPVASPPPTTCSSSVLLKGIPCIVSADGKTRELNLQECEGRKWHICTKQA
jgi:hypothetical protein